MAVSQVATIRIRHTGNSFSIRTGRRLNHREATIRAERNNQGAVIDAPTFGPTVVQLGHVRSVNEEH